MTDKHERKPFIIRNAAFSLGFIVDPGGGKRHFHVLLGWWVLTLGTTRFSAADWNHVPEPEQVSAPPTVESLSGGRNNA